MKINILILLTLTAFRRSGQPYVKKILDSLIDIIQTLMDLESFGVALYLPYEGFVILI